MTLKQKMQLPVDICSILNNLKNNNEDAFIIGGSCRDYLMGKEVSDYDVVTSATPEKIKEIYPHAITAGNSFLVSIINEIEVATYRKDRSDDAIVAKTLYEDVQRRDFTINSIAYNCIDDLFIDHVGGLDDIKNRALRFIGNAEQRIIEDPVRILRGIRFAAKYNLTIEKESFFAMMVHRKLLCDIPTERIQKEIIKAFSMDNTHRFLTMLNEMEILECVFPSIFALREIDGGGHHNETVLTHSFGAVKALEEKKWELKLAALYHDVGKRFPEVNDKGWNTFKGHNKFGLDYVESDLRNYLKFSNKIVDYIKCLTINHMGDVVTDRHIKRLAIKLNKYNVPFKDWCYIRYADCKGNVLFNTNYISTSNARPLYKRYLEIINEKPPFSVKDLAINGQDVMCSFGLTSGGRIVGEALTKIFELVINGELTNTRNELLEQLERLSYDRNGGY